MEPTKEQVDRTLNSLAKHPTRQLAEKLIADRRVKPLPVHEIMRRKDEELEKLIGKR